MILLSRYGLREWLAITLLATPLGVFFAWFAMARHSAWWIGLAIVAVVWFAGVMFFRDPLGRRPASEEPRDMVSPADGRVSAVLELEHHAAVGGPALLIRIFLSVLDVHLNRAPCDGGVTEITHTPGRYLDARSEESAKVNESLLMVMRAPWGDPIGIRQVSGAIARRIVNPLRPGATLRRGERYGMIKFGSTTELIVPARSSDGRKAEALVAKGDRVVGGVTIIARV
ncbi:MAG: phosphatidylserine decarboxylase [Phycisphaeraceae bacterium]|nr:phosphatidylserine decarboxylase [Phycisphaeraceae bacterium]